ncbi:MAG: TIGR00270 family protein [Methanomassiliicoccus sp.]|nr:TIGR00270 family protein [Methanomassiliicoccus sp.]
MKRTAMLCEMCGKDSEFTKTIFVEGSKLKVCKECSRFGESSEGKTGGAKKGAAAAPSRTVVAERLEARERRMKTRSIYADEETSDLIPDYSRVIREARMARDWKHEDLAAKLNERASVIAKLENGTMRPNDSLLKKLEHELGVKLTEKVAVVRPEGGHSQGKVLTLGDMIKKK